MNQDVITLFQNIEDEMMGILTDHHEALSKAQDNFVTMDNQISELYKIVKLLIDQNVVLHQQMSKILEIKPEMSWKDKAVALKLTGMNNADIARQVEKSRTSVSTWLNTPEALTQLQGNQ